MATNELGAAPITDERLNAKAEPVQLAAYTMVINQMMNLDEVLNK